MKINHVLIQTNDLLAMSDFLKQVTGLQEGYRPPFPFPGIWIYSKDKPIFHLVQILPNKQQSEYLGNTQDHYGAGAFDHVAIEGADY